MLPEKTLTYDYQEGEEYPLLLLHGFCGNRHIWQRVISSLPTKTAYLCPDLTGFGGSESLIYGGITLHNIADDVRQLIEHLEISKVHLVGHSLGGYVGLAFAEQYADKLASLTLLQSTAQADSPEKQRTRNNIIQFIRKNGAKAFVKNFIKPLFYPSNIEQDKSILSVAQEIAEECSADSLIFMSEAMRERPDYQVLLADLEIPVQWIIGREDSIIPIQAYTEQIWQAKNSTIHIMDKIGHMALLENPQKIAKLITNFCRKPN